ncbi:2OG-Fe(II) oxygenase [Actinomycetospora sp. OC33-EN08]|uniref:2OG-Fe(II) oxygenase n=1 Tax=Actinomycetospora aurantiaca TaxID=3129233 RepID=A0ABU8MPN3_9PSEU
MSADPVALLDGFCDAGERLAVLHELRYCHWSPSTVVRRHEERLVTSSSPARTSTTTDQWWFPPELLALTGRIESRLAERFAVEPDHLDPWQATRYEVGETFGLHHDAGHWVRSPAGERRRTVLIYLEEPDEGGGTEFPSLDLLVAPRAGRVAVWDNLRPDGRVDPFTRHIALPVLRGRKTVLTTWERVRPTCSRRESLP